MCLQKYREKVPHLSYGKKDLINNVFVPEENFNFPEIIRFLRFFICLLMIFLLNFLDLKIYFHSPSRLGKVLFSTLELNVNTKRIKLIFYMNCTRPSFLNTA